MDPLYPRWHHPQPPEVASRNDINFQDTTNWPQIRPPILQYNLHTPIHLTSHLHYIVQWTTNNPITTSCLSRHRGIIPTIMAESTSTLTSTSAQTLASKDEKKQVELQTTLPRIAIKFCTQCRWMLRAAYVCSFFFFLSCLSDPYLQILLRYKHDTWYLICTERHTPKSYMYTSSWTYYLHTTWYQYSYHAMTTPKTESN
jgi:hypothetical protein